ncbi:MAG: hypothetical protein RR691_05790 [Eubacterium sp.]
MEFKSEYYTALVETMDKYEVDPSAYDFAAESIQSVEEMLFGFAMTILM